MRSKPLYERSKLIFFGNPEVASVPKHEGRGGKINLIQQGSKRKCIEVVKRLPSATAQRDKHSRVIYDHNRDREEDGGIQENAGKLVTELKSKTSTNGTFQL